MRRKPLYVYEYMNENVSMSTYWYWKALEGVDKNKHWLPKRKGDTGEEKGRRSKRVRGADFFHPGDSGRAGLERMSPLRTFQNRGEGES